MTGICVAPFVRMALDARQSTCEAAAVTAPPGVHATGVALAQGVYYSATGLWPLLSMKSFEAVTGPKRDRWLVKTVGVLVTAVGVTLIRASRRRRVHPDVALLGGLSAAALAGIDIVYVSRRRISPVYLLDSVPEVLLALWWGRRVALSGRSRLRRRSARIAAKRRGWSRPPSCY